MQGNNVNIKNNNNKLKQSKMKKGKKTIRLTESEMVSLIENIVNQVKSEKKREITESRNRKPVSRRPISRNKRTQRVRR